MNDIPYITRRQTSCEKHQRITPCLWLDRQAEEAAGFYTGIFRNSKILNVSYYGEAGQDVPRASAGNRDDRRF